MFVPSLSWQSDHSFLTTKPDGKRPFCFLAALRLKYHDGKAAALGISEHLMQKLALLWPLLATRLDRSFGSVGSGRDGRWSADAKFVVDFWIRVVRIGGRAVFRHGDVAGRLGDPYQVGRVERERALRSSTCAVRQTARPVAAPAVARSAVFICVAGLVVCQSGWQQAYCLCRQHAYDDESVYAAALPPIKDGFVVVHQVLDVSHDIEPHAHAWQPRRVVAACCRRGLSQRYAVRGGLQSDIQQPPVAGGGGHLRRLAGSRSRWLRTRTASKCWLSFVKAGARLRS